MSRLTFLWHLLKICQNVIFNIFMTLQKTCQNITLATSMTFLSKIQKPDRFDIKTIKCSINFSVRSRVKGSPNSFIKADSIHTINLMIFIL